VIPKQDRTPVRQAREIERKYNLNNDFTEIEKMATNAQRTAEVANSKATSAVATAGEAASKANAVGEQFNSLSERVSQNTESISFLDNRVKTLEESGTGGGEPGVGLSVVNGLLCITYKEGE
jgi:methyl-accepting chemotaxis protein